MHAITPDGKHLLLLDAFGLTRLTFPNKLKTERKAMASEDGALTLDAAGARALVWDDDWCQLHLFALPELKRAGSFNRFAHEGARLLPDGEHLVRLASHSVEVYSLRANEGKTVAIPAVSKSAGTAFLGREGVRRAALWSSLAVGADGTLALLLEHEKRARLVVGALDDDRFVARAEVMVTVGGGGPLRLTAGEGGATLRLVEPGVETVFGLRVERDGSARNFTVPGLSPPARDGDTWVTQLAPDVVARCGDDGVVRERWEIRDPKHHGVGEVIAHGGKAWIVPPHRECLVALPSNEVTARKLTEKEAPVRRYYTPIFARYNRAGAEYGRVFWLGRTSFWNHGTQVSGTFTPSPGDGTLGANVLCAALFEELGDGDTSALAPFKRGGTGARNYTTALVVPITEPEVLRLFATCDEHRVWLPYALGWITDLYKRRIGGGTGVWGEPDGPPGELGAERVLLRGVLHHLADPSAPALTPHVEAWRGELREEDVRASLMRIADESPHMPARAYEGVAWMLARVFEAPAAARLLVWMLLDGSENQLTNSSYEVRNALNKVLSKDPVLRAQAVEWVRAHAPAPRKWGGPDRRDELLESLSTATW